MRRNAWRWAWGACFLGALACGKAGPAAPAAGEGESAKAAAPTPAVGANAGAQVDPAPPEVGPVAEDPSFSLRLEAADKAVVGKLGAVSVTLLPKGGYHVNQEFPLKVEVDAPAAFTLPKRVFEKADAAEFKDERARIDVPFTPSAPGEHRISAKVSFAVCTPETCVPDERTLALAVTVE